MKKLRGLMVVMSVLILGACSNFKTHSEIDALNEVQPVGSAFTQALAIEYREFANSKMDMMDYPDALHFARKGLAAAAGEVVMPEPISDWNLLPRHMEELSEARGRLIVAFDLGAREIAPALAAMAQARFDCWIEEQEANWHADGILRCKSEFLDAMANLEDMLEPVAPVAPPQPEPTYEVPEAAEPMMPEDAMYLVFFDFDSTEIGAGGQNVLDAVADEINSRSVSVVRIVGHTDSAGPRSYNERLAMRRANAVRDALTARGVDASVLRVEGRGQDEQLVETADNVREPANRRAQITFE